MWTRFRHPDGRACVGTLANDRIVEHSGDLFERPAPTGATVSDADVTLLAPCQPGKIVALWNNFHALAAKLQKPLPRHPLFLIKPSTCVAGPGTTIRRPPGYTGRIAFEGELGIVIGRRCSAVSPGCAREHIFGYTCVNDVTAVDVLDEDETFAQWCRAKGHDTFGCIGPVIATELDFDRARVITRVDAVERQNYALADMAFAPAELVSLISHDMTLSPGDVIACGTSLGVGSMKDGATVEVTIDGIGTLVNHVAASAGMDVRRAA